MFLELTWVVKTNFSIRRRDHFVATSNCISRDERKRKRPQAVKLDGIVGEWLCATYKIFLFLIGF